MGGFRLLDNVVNNGISDNLPDKFYGRATLSGLEEILLYPIKFFGAEINSFNNIIAQYTQKAVAIGTQTPYFNAFYTCVMYFFIDGGVLGVIVFSSLHGLLIAYGIRLYSKKKDLMSLILLNFLIVNLFTSIYKWPYQSGATTFLLIVLIILNYKKEIGEIIKKWKKKIMNKE